MKQTGERLVHIARCLGPYLLLILARHSLRFRAGSSPWLLCVAILAWCYAVEMGVSQCKSAADWRAQAKACGLTALEIQSLETNGIVVIGQTVEPAYIYRRDGGTIFVTSDTMIATFSALLRAGFIEVEHANAEYLRRAFGELWEQIAADRGSDACGELSGPAQEGVLAAKSMVATVLFLLGDAIENLDLATAEAVKAELSLIRAARTAPRSAALTFGRKGGTVPYEQCSPRGDYQHDPVTRRYFQAISWLQLTSIPLSLRQGRACGVTLARALARSKSVSRKLARVDVFIESFVGVGAHVGGFSEFSRAFGDKGLALGAGLSEAIERVEVFVAEDESTVAKGHAKWRPRDLRFFRQVKVPSTSFFRALPDVGLRPSGLHLAAALGSRFARQSTRITQDKSARLCGAETRKDLLAGPSIHTRFLRCLSVLLEYEDKRLPAFMHTRSWQAKTCSTALCGWAWQMYLGGLWADATSGSGPDGTPVGLVEPNPAFYRCLREAALSASKLLARNREEAAALLNDGSASRSWQKVAWRSASRVKRWGIPEGWDWLISSLRDFERIASNQLDNRKMSEKDVQVLKRFGRDFEKFLGCAVRFVGRPPACVSGVYRESPESILHAAVSSARPIWVLYPWNDETVLCRGVVWLYHEFWESRPVSDEEWWKRLRSTKRPDLPAWLRGVVSDR